MTVIGPRDEPSRSRSRSREPLQPPSALGKVDALIAGRQDVDANLIAAPSSTKSARGTRDPTMHQTKKGNQRHFGMKAHIDADLGPGLVHTVVGTAAHVNDVKVGYALLHCREIQVFADARYRGAHKRSVATVAVWHVAMRASERKRWKRGPRIGRLLDCAERVKASVRAKIEHLFRALELQFGYRKRRCRGLAKNTAQLQTPFALTNRGWRGASCWRWTREAAGSTARDARETEEEFPKTVDRRSSMRSPLSNHFITFTAALPAH